MGCITFSDTLLCNLMVEHEDSGVGVDDRMLTDVFSALADPTRRAIVRRLASGEATISELSKPFEMSFQAVSKHVQVLEHAGLVTRTRRAQERPCRLRPEAMVPASVWLGDYHQLWETSFGRLDEHLNNQKEPRS
jgi:DNA-binding transcriptional ArsR family regulator